MLANPQNLDISSFLQSPKTSPFAVALAASKVMLVVPNRHQSVYTRLWCTYEAYLAQEDGKTILIAHSSNLPQVLRALIWLALAAIIGVALGILATFLEARQTFTVPALTILAVGFSLLIDNDLLRRIMHFGGVMLCWICVAHNFGGVFGEFVEGHYEDEGIPGTVIRLVHRGYWLLASVAFCVMEVDRINGRSTISEAEELRQGYEGSIQYAKCSQEADAVSIRREIGDQVEKVDHAIHVLMVAGMSTPALRDIARSVDIQHAAVPEITGAIFLFGPFATNALTMTVVSFIYNQPVWYRAVLAGVSVLSRLSLLFLLCRSDWDEHRFILKVMSKFLFVAMLGWLFLVAFFLLLDLSISAAWNIWLLIGDSCLLSMLLLALLGIRGTARLPFGLKILQIFFSRGSNTWTALKLCVRSPSTYLTTSDESSDSDPDTSGNG